MTQGKPKVLVVEDDRKTADIIRVYLEKDGYCVDIAHDGRAGLKAALAGQPDLVILDLLLPEVGGLDVCVALRAQSLVPVIVLTALTTEHDKLTGLDLGADDYVTKPFSPRELVARVRAVLRRTAEEGRDGAQQALSYSDLTLDPSSHTFKVQGRETHLTPTEFRLLELFMRDPGRLFSRSQLVDRALGYDYEGMDRTVDVHILNLRRKIEPDPKRPKYVRTVYGEGYKLGG